ncbi:MAG: DegV family EDD domain-containing protein [Bacteroidales bacterium]|nr:DegV family EDD domain-containing protein [Bacteroidales bacterium]MCF8344998.1 DegV family EDD domain-containing protein [Bacteroidales bacterium]MCF8351711.1 DegV family EDD domain-containing protein [Bacteroidales bacterium]MCF8377011.1 DegV family EDD domain-containing protein [Bacteroidales bacterium]MCF8400910.1 DegV family EDD domain-containing protein [Bacteroidales bacterium]
MNQEKNTLKSWKILDGKQLYYSFLAGAQRLFENQKDINKINVFPVPDGDTGTNLASTMRSIVESSVPSKDIQQTATSLADAALVGARGNSGIIFAQFLYGFSAELENRKTLDVHSFSNSVNNAVKYAYESISNPVEGTMITVIREWAESLQTWKNKMSDFGNLFTSSFKNASQSLKETTQKLEVLAKNKVVDAGAKGFVVFLEGIVDFFKNGEIRKLMKSKIYTGDFEEKIESIPHEEFTFRYCAEALISGENMDRCLMIKKLEDYGDSIVVAGSPTKIRIHIHTDQPTTLFRELSKCGIINSQKVDDMYMQNEITHHRKNNIALLTDSTCDLPPEIIQKHQIHTVPLSIHFGENYFLDQVTLTSKHFYEMLEHSDVYPSSAQPSYKEFFNRYSYLSTHYEDILAIHISGKLSGTYSNSQKAAGKVARENGQNIRVIDSKKVTGAVGLIILRAAQEIEKGTSFDELVEQVKDWVGKTDELVSVKTLKYMVKGGRVSPMKGRIAKLLNLKPIVSIDGEGNSILYDKSFSEKGSMKKVIKLLLKKTAGKKLWGYSINHANNPETANWYKEKMTELTGTEPAFIYDTSPVIGVNAGIGSVSLNFMTE